MSRITNAWILGALALASVRPSHAQSNEGPPAYPTNMAMLTDAARASVSEMFLTFNIPQESSILLESESPHEAKWFVQNLILDQLTDRGFVVTLKPEETTPMETDAEYDSTLSRTTADPLRMTDEIEGLSPQDSTKSTSTGTVEDTASEASYGAEDEDAGVDYILRFRVAECGLTYPKAFRKSPFGSKLVQRFASVSVFGTVVKGDRESVVWVGRGDAERLDHVPTSKLPLLEGKTFPFTHPEVESRGLDAYAEPALVLSIVLGLVYLFYTNQ